jgi:hypothetical protein
MYTVIPTERFEQDVKYYVTEKGFTHIGGDIKVITDELEKGNLLGTEIPGLKVRTDGHIVKVRSVSTDSGEGQSDGSRTIYYAVRDEEEVYLLTIYYKQDNNEIPANQEIIEAVETYFM